MTRKKNSAISRQEEIVGILLITLGILIFISLVTYDFNEQPDQIPGRIHNKLGVAGIYISHFLIQYTIGYPAFVFPIIMLLVGWSLFRSREFSKTFRLSFYILIFAIYTSIILAIPEVTSDIPTEIGFRFSGLMGGLIAKTLFSFLGVAGSIVVLLSLIMITVIGATRLSFSDFLTNIASGFSSALASIRDGLAEFEERRRLPKDKPSRIVSRDFDLQDDEADLEGAAKNKKMKLQTPSKQIEIELKTPVARPATSDALPEEPLVKMGNYVFPSIDLLTLPTGNSEIPEAELTASAQILEDRLLEFAVEGKVVKINPGPVITRYEVAPAPGVKISKIVNLADDLALAMRAKRLRIVAPIPGKAAVGIELPNREHSVVYMREVLSSVAFKQTQSPLTLALGKTISGEPYIAHLDQMPHLLIAGSTGSGKSVCLNSIIASILYKAHPTAVEFIMIDPKRLELSIYNNLRHHHLNYREDLNEEVVTNAANSISVLKSVETVMERRYEILARAGVRNIRDYNQKLAAGLLKNMEEEEDPFSPLPYLVLIIDELADLMLTAAREVEEPIARLTQMSRAVGIHLIVATQRPSVDVITGVIKANFPARIAFQVASKTDSRTILDLNGAEKLLGLGDMLFVPPGSPEPVRIHGAFISGEEIEQIIAHIRKQPRYPKKKLPVSKEEAAVSIEPGSLGGQRDKLFDEAMKLVVRHQQGSISLLQRRLKVGYARAARLIDELEAAGVVGLFDGSKAREVLMDESELEELGFS